MSQLNLRIFRRNSKNLIFLWSSSALTPEQQESLRVYAVDGASQRELTYRPFVPDNPAKFMPDVAGVVINHSSNGLDPAKACTVRVVFGVDDETIEIEKEVNPASPDGPMQGSARPPAAAAATTVKAAGQVVHIHLYAQDAATGDWKPLAWSPELRGEVFFKEAE